MGIDLNDIDSRSGFPNEHREQLQGEDLIKYLIASNEILKDKVHTYYKKYEEAQDRCFTIEENSQKKINSICKFYRDMLYLSKLRSATMVKAALKTNNS